MNSIQEHIGKMKTIQNSILNFLSNEKDEEELFQNLIQQINELNISTDPHNLKALLYLLSKILNNHYRGPDFFTKIERIFRKYQTEIKRNFNDNEIFQIFKKCPRFLHFLVKEKIITINEDILEDIPTYIFIYLFPKEAHQKKLISEVPSKFEEKQNLGENDSLISKMIRQDLIDEFISYVNQHDYSMNSIIQRSIFETNHFLMKQKQITLIEYAAFFGSTQIFQYLYKNGVELVSSLWIYGIHSDNPEMIHLLEENEVMPPNQSYKKCIKESIKCHHNDIVNYIQSNKLNEDIKSIDGIDFEQCYNDNIFSYSYHYYNFSYFPQEMNDKINFYYACQYDYFQIVEYFLKTNKIDINKRIILKNFIVFIKFKKKLFQMIF